MFVTIRQLLAALAFALLGGVCLAPPVGATDHTWVVDDRAQCPHARFRSIQAAVNRANAYDVIKICAGRYAEQVTVDKPLEIEGDGASVMKTATTGDDAGTIDAADCFSPTRPTFDLSAHVIVAPPLDAPSDVPTVLFDLQADNISLEGFILQGNDDTKFDADPSRAAVETSAAHSGYKIHHNFFLANTVATFLRSNGEHPSSFHDNCLRESGWGVANNFEPLIDARVHHNNTFKTRNFVYEQTACNVFPCTGVGMDRVTFDHNVSNGDDSVFRLAFSTSTIVVENNAASARIGVRLAGGSADLAIVGNELDVRLGGIVSGSGLAPNTRVLIERNVITGRATNAGIGMGAGALKASAIVENSVVGVDGEGIALLAGNTENVVRGNVSLDNGRNGIFAAGGATSNTFESKPDAWQRKDFDHWG